MYDVCVCVSIASLLFTLLLVNGDKFSRLVQTKITPICAYTICTHRLLYIHSVTPPNKNNTHMCIHDVHAPTFRYTFGHSSKQKYHPHVRTRLSMCTHLYFKHSFSHGRLIFNYNGRESPYLKRRSFIFIYFKYIYTGWTIQLHCSSMVPCYKIKYINIKNTYIHTHK